MAAYMQKIPKVKSVLLAIAIAVVFIFFVVYGISTFHAAPEIDDFCEGITYRTDVDSCPPSPDSGLRPVPVDKECYCDNQERCTEKNPERDKCEEEYDEERSKYELVVFIVMTVVGLAVIIASFFIGNAAMSSGLMGGGILSIFVGAVRNWGNFQDWMRFILLGIALAALIWVSYKKLNR